MIDVDREVANADWLRAGAWDVWTPDDPPHLVNTLEELRRALGESGRLASDDAIRRFVALPADLRQP